MKKIIKIIIIVIIAISVILLVGCLKVQQLGPTTKTNHAISGPQDLTLNEQDLRQLGTANNTNETDLEQLGLKGTNCKTEEQSAFDLSPVQYSICSYIINNLNTQVIIEVKKFINLSEIDDAYQYSSLHLYSVEGLISENDFGDKSRFRVNNKNDYGGQYDKPGFYYYHLWICKNTFLIDISSSGRSKDAKDYVAKIGRLILAKFK